MSLPNSLFEQPIHSEAADAITVVRILHDSRIVAELEQQFEPEVIQCAVEVAGAQQHASIEAALPNAASVSMFQKQRFVRHEQMVEASKDNFNSLEHTMPGTEATLLAEPEFGNELQLRNYSQSESRVVLRALRAAAHTKGYRREATDVLSRCAPTRHERTRCNLALKVGKLIA